MRDVAIEAAQKAGEVLEKYFDTTGLERQEKDDKSFVTKADHEAEAAIVEVVKKALPDHGFLGEEGHDTNPDAEYRWVVDPLDATRNFANGIPIFAVSIAIVQNGVPVIAVIHNPVTRSLYVAERGRGATYNGASMHVSVQDAAHGIITFGPGQKDKEKLNTLMSKSEDFFKSKRYLGCTALELAYVARGGTEAFVCIGLKQWDYAAGTLLVQEAGGTITDWEGKSWTLTQNYFVASNGVAHQASLDLLKVLH
jgi:myo-inositol-1(or 4)-monophosphatase